MKLPISRYTIYGNSMVPTLKPGQDILSFNWFIKPKVGDIVIVQSEKFKVQSVKRIKQINGNEVWIEGDNGQESTDSRHFGPISMDQVVGKVIYMDSRFRENDKMVDCPQCGTKVIGIYGRKDAICSNCGFKLTCCGV